MYKLVDVNPVRTSPLLDPHVMLNLLVFHDRE